MADMVNHRLPPNTKWYYSDEEGGFILRASKAIKKNDEISLMYGEAISNAKCFYQYGFIYHPNPYDECVLAVQMD